MPCRQSVFVVTALTPMLFAGFLTAPARAQEASRYNGPIIDVHLHAYLPDEYHGASTPNPVTGEVPVSRTAEEHMRATLAEMERLNVVLGLVGGPLEALERWREAAPGRILAGAEFGRPGVDDSGRPISVDTLRSLYRSGRLQVMGEITAQYEGLSPSDPALDPYFALAEELNIPVGIHTGSSFPGTPYSGSPNFRVALGNPLLLEDLLVSHPDLRVFIMHGGLPWQREAVALMQMYPQVYMDVAVVNWIGGPRAVPRFHAFLRDMIAEGLGKRIMFGTDQMRWPEAIEMAIESVKSADFLTAEQVADIFYHNAARFLELNEHQIAGHHSITGQQ